MLSNLIVTIFKSIHGAVREGLTKIVKCEGRPEGDEEASPEGWTWGKELQG